MYNVNVRLNIHLILLHADPSQITSLRVCMHVRTYVYMYVYVRMSFYANVYVKANISITTYTYIHT